MPPPSQSPTFNRSQPSPKTLPEMNKSNDPFQQRERERERERERVYHRASRGIGTTSTPVLTTIPHRQAL